jgi:hypothetical protein
MSLLISDYGGGGATALATAGRMPALLVLMRFFGGWGCVGRVYFLRHRMRD